MGSYHDIGQGVPQTINLLSKSAKPVCVRHLGAQNVPVAEKKPKKNPARAKRMAHLFQHLGVSHATIAGIAKIRSPNTVTDWVNIGRQPGDALVFRIADHFGFDRVELSRWIKTGKDAMPDRRISEVHRKPAAIVQSHHPCPTLTRFMTHCYQRKEVVADALMTAMDDYVDRYGGTEMVGESEERKR